MKISSVFFMTRDKIKCMDYHMIPLKTFMEEEEEKDYSYRILLEDFA